MIENEVKIYDSKIDLHSGGAEKTNSILSLPLKTMDLANNFENTSSKQILRFARQRKIKRTKSSGIF